MSTSAQTSRRVRQNQIGLFLSGLALYWSPPRRAVHHLSVTYELNDWGNISEVEAMVSSFLLSTVSCELSAFFTRPADRALRPHANGSNPAGSLCPRRSSLR